MSTAIKDKNRMPEYIDILNELLTNQIHIGIFGEDTDRYEDGATVLLIANVNEFGCDIRVTPKMRAYLRSQGLPLKASTEEIKIPERSFIRSGFDDRENNVQSRAIKLLKKVLLMELDIDTFFNLIGQYVVDQLKEYMTALDNPQNHPFTVERKESSNPLIDSGRMRDAITFKVVKSNV